MKRVIRPGLFSKIAVPCTQCTPSLIVFSPKHFAINHIIYFLSSLNYYSKKASIFAS